MRFSLTSYLLTVGGCNAQLIRASNDEKTCGGLVFPTTMGTDCE